MAFLGHSSPRQYPSLPYAERTEDRTQQIIGRIGSSDFAQGLLCVTKLLGGKFAGVAAVQGIGCAFEMLAHGFKGRDVAATRAERTFARACRG
jgi:hypothetical protein